MLIHAILPGQNLKKNSKTQSENHKIKSLSNKNKNFSLEKIFSMRFINEPGI